jgi:dUTP pyrophosphatase
MDLRWQPSGTESFYSPQQWYDRAYVLWPGRTTVPLETGIVLGVPDGWEGQIRPRSGLAAKGITVSNSPGTVDSGYRGEVRVALINHGPDRYIVKPGDRIAQLAIRRAPNVQLVWVSKLNETDRGSGGFGSTGR